jgi:hypothetical protein
METSAAAAASVSINNEPVEILEIVGDGKRFSLCGEGIIRHFKPVAELPTKKDLRTLNVDKAIEHIQSTIFGANFSSIKTSFCYLTEEYQNVDNIVMSYLRGNYNTHKYPGGAIAYNECYKHFMECCSIQHMINNNMIDVSYIYSQFPKQVKIPRSKRPGDTEDRFNEGNIISRSATVYSTRKETLNVFVEFIEKETDIMFKTIGIKDLMKANDIEKLDVFPLIFSNEFIGEQIETVGKILCHYNTVFMSFVRDNICAQLDKEEIPYTVEYRYFNL